jgi:hypothetical protein
MQNMNSWKALKNHSRVLRERQKIAVNRRAYKEHQECWIRQKGALNLERAGVSLY